MASIARQELVKLFSAFDRELFHDTGVESGKDLSDFGSINEGSIIQQNNEEIENESMNTSDLSLPESFANNWNDSKLVRSSLKNTVRKNDTSEWNTTAESIVKLKEEVQRLRKVLSDRNDKFKDITISQEMFNELRNRPVESLTLYELACMRATDYCFKMKRDLETSRVTNDELKERYERAITTIQAQEAELSTNRKLFSIAEDGRKLELLALDEKCERLIAQLNTERVLRKAYEDKASAYDILSKESSLSQEEITQLKSLVAQQKIIVETLGQSETRMRHQTEDSEKARHLLEKDKIFLREEVLRLQSLLDDRNRELDHNQVKMATLELKTAQLTDQILAVQLTNKTVFEERIEKEIRRVREDAERDVEAIKSSTSNLYEREARMLRDSLMTVQSENDMLKRKSDHLLNENSVLVRELSQQKLEKSNEISELRADLKLKAFECLSLGTKYEEKMHQVRTMESELEMIRQELQAHKTSIIRLESDMAKREDQLHQEIEYLQKKVTMYDILEQDIDDSIQKIADDKADNQIESLGTQALIFNLARNPERRIQQTISIAHRLVIADRQRSELTVKLKESEDLIDELQKRVKMAQEDMKLVTEPASYLTIKLREEEATKLAWMSKSNHLEDNLSRLSKQKDSLQDEVMSLREKLSLLLKQRSEIDALRELVESWQQAQEEDSMNESLVDEEVQTSTLPENHVEESFHSRKDRNEDNAMSFADLGLSPRIVSRMLTPPSSVKSRKSS